MANVLKVSVFLWLLCAATYSMAAERPAGDPRVLVEKHTLEIAEIARTATNHEKMIADISAVMAKVIDYEAFSKRTLKGTWESLKMKDRTRFVEAFKGLVMHTYAKRFTVGASFNVSYRGDTVWSEPDKARATVKSTISGKRAAADVDYVIVASASKKEDVWKVVDIVIDDVSMALNWRRQFKRIVERDGFERLIEKIHHKTRAK